MISETAMKTRSETMKSAILKALHELDRPAGALRVTERLASMGMNPQPRTVRLHLLQLDREGLTRLVSRRRGREITERGRKEIAGADVMAKVGFVAARIDALGYQMSFDHGSGSGTIVTNLAVIRKEDLSRTLTVMEPVFTRHFSMGGKLALARAGATLGGMVVPAYSVAIGTVSSVTLNGVLLSRGIPVTSRFGGLIEIFDGKPRRFVELIEYTGTTVDPLEVFIRAGMTHVRECVRTGSGVIGASLREIPALATENVRSLQRAMESHGIGGILAVGRPNQPLFGVPVAEGRSGVVVLGGLNPIAAMHEAGVRSSLLSLAGLEDFSAFSTFREVYQNYMASLR
jgi:HTH-type transcriptional regulator, global nitrogen regulator NrpRI